jgi:hypothetical protein
MFTFWALWKTDSITDSKPGARHVAVTSVSNSFRVIKILTTSLLTKNTLKYASLVAAISGFSDQDTGLVSMSKVTALPHHLYKSPSLTHQLSFLTRSTCVPK